MTRRRTVIITISAVLAPSFIIACGGDTVKGGDVEPLDVTPAIAGHDLTPNDAYTVNEMHQAAPEADEEQLWEWLQNRKEHNRQVRAWNDCLDSSPTGEGCTAADESLLEEDPIYGPNS